MLIISIWIIVSCINQWAIEWIVSTIKFWKMEPNNKRKERKNLCVKLRRLSFWCPIRSYPLSWLHWKQYAKNGGQQVAAMTKDANKNGSYAQTRNEYIEGREKRELARPREIWKTFYCMFLGLMLHLFSVWCLPFNI